MNKKVRVTIIVVIAAIIVAAAAYFIVTKVGKEAEETADETYAETQIEQDTETAEQGIDENDLSAASTDGSDTSATTDNSELAQQIVPSTAMEEVINANADRLTSDVSSSSTSYPGNLVPLYDLAQLGDINDIVTSDDKAGWKLSYGSNSSVEDISAFYESLLSQESGYGVSTESSTTKITGTTDGYNISIEVSPNNPERTGLNYTTDVSILISAQ